MDRKTLLAILLSLIVVIVFQTFLFPKPEPVTEADPAPTLTGTGETPPPPSTTIGTSDRDVDPILDPDPGAAPTDQWTGAASEEEIVVETEQYRAVFSNRGGLLRSFRLLQFEDPVGQPVELVLGTGELGLALESGSLRDLDRRLFRAERHSEGGAQVLTFELRNPAGAVVRKTYRLPDTGYLAQLKVELRGMDAEGYRLTWNGGIPRAEKNPKQYSSSAGTIVLRGKDKETVRSKDFKKESEKEVQGNIRWAGVRNKYFMATMVPPEETSSRVIAVGNHELDITGAQIAMPMLQGGANHEFQVYLGPMEYASLKEMGYGLQKAVDLGWKLFRPVSKLMLAAMTFMHGFIPNYGIVIILISVLTKVLFYPLTKSSMKSMRAMQKLQPEISALREKYKDKPQVLQAKTMEMYKKNKVNPVGGCLPIVVQMPVFIALYQVLANDITVRNAPFTLWINDLSSPDTIATIAGFSIHVLPIILFIFTFLQTLLTPQTDPRQKMMGYMMPLVTLFIFYGFPAGLALYWTVNSILTVAQQWAIHREDPHLKPAVTPA